MGDKKLSSQTSSTIRKSPTKSISAKFTLKDLNGLIDVKACPSTEVETNLLDGVSENKNIPSDSIVKPK